MNEIANLDTRFLIDAPSIVFLMITGALFYSTFCRLNKLDRTAMLAVRIAYWLLCVAAALSFLSVIAWNHDASWVECALAGAFAFVQVVPGRAWRHGYPASLITTPDYFDDAIHHHEMAKSP